MNKTVFIVDDDRILRFMIEKMMIRKNGDLEIIQCENGKVGLEKLKTHDRETEQRIILLDLNMPVLDGWGFLDEVQSTLLADYEPYKYMTLYILSSSINIEDIEKAKEYSFVKKFYHKPLSIADITEILSNRT